jgi:hypothetical protein
VGAPPAASVSYTYDLDLTISWTKVSGPGSVTFTSPNMAVTQATFSAAGTYVLQLAASDGQLNNSSNVTVTVNSTAMNILLTELCHLAG